MTNNPYPCNGCVQTLCDYRQCAAYCSWLCDAWNLFQSSCCHNYWEDKGQPDDKLLYLHPGVLQRYLQRGPCERCICCNCCDLPCKRYWQWWDARMVWLKRKLQK